MVILLHDFHVTDEEENITSTIGEPSNDFCGLPIKSPIFSRTSIMQYFTDKKQVQKVLILFSLFRKWYTFNF